MKRGQVKIIGGQWRGRNLSIVETVEIRPTPNRVRETLFNWLMSIVPGAKCLDLFTGSGALGVEALSRGASHAVLVDQSFEVVKLLKEELAVLGAKNAEVFQARLPDDWGFLNKTTVKVFDLVFLDPPYRENLLLPLCFALEEKNLLAKDAYIYLESDQELLAESLPPTWEIIKAKKAGQVGYYLVRRQGA